MEIIVELKEFFAATPKTALGLSGGADSAYLLYAGVKAGADVRPYYIKSQFQPAFELEDAKKMCGLCGVELNMIQLDVLAAPNIAENPADRCYYCKKAIFSALLEGAKRDGYDVIIDGTNASDDAGDRPGMRALEEMKILSPLRECGITKDEVRRYSAEAGLFTADKPAYACLATRIPAGQPITAPLLEKIERGENALFAMGYTDFRVRLVGTAAKLQFPKSQLMQAAGEWDDIRAKLKKDFSAVVLDLKGR